jgi:hypothetical protein
LSAADFPVCASEPFGVPPESINCAATSFESSQFGVLQLAKLAVSAKFVPLPSRSHSRCIASGDLRAMFSSVTLGDGQVAKWHTTVSFDSPPPPPDSLNISFLAASGCSVLIEALGVGHKVQSLPDVRSTEARSAGIDRPDGVTRSFQVRRNKVEPSERVL